MTTKILALADALGDLSDFRLLPGQTHDLRGTAALIAGLACGQFLADRAFEANWLREALTDAGIQPVIPPKSNRGRVSNVVEIGGRRNLRVPRSTDRRLLPPRRSRHEGRYRDLGICATGRGWRI